MEDIISIEDRLDKFFNALTALPLESLHAEKARIENSIQHLVRSNKEIEEYILSLKEEEEKEERLGLKCVIKENEDVVTDQKQRIAMIDAEIKRRT
ncbi:hypothetical protein V1511DRAFT_496187 [Dipodascopsis uninucleata]